MRIIVNLVALLVAVVAAGVFYFNSAQHSMDEELAREARDVVREVEQTLRLQATKPNAPVNIRGYVTTIDPAWFDAIPRNPLVSPATPWIEIAPRESADLWHPEVRLAVHPDLAGLWYNPYRGIVRARVPVQVNDERSTQLYNRVNGTRLSSILEPEPATHRSASVVPEAPQGSGG